MMGAPSFRHLRRLAAYLVVAVAVVLLASPLAAHAADADEVVGTAEEDTTGPGGLCGVAPGVVGDVCGAVGGVIGDGVGLVVGGGADAVLGAMVSFVVDGAGWLLERLATFIDSSTSPDIQSGWFRAAYRDMALIGMLGLLPFLLLALMQALIRQDVGMMLRATFGFVPLAAIGTAGAIVVVDLLVQLTDQLSGLIARGLGSDLSSFATGVGTALARISAPTGGAVAGLAALIGAAVIAFAAFVIWLELLLRQAAIYVAVLFFPLGFMAMVWPATAHWVRRLSQGLVAIILSKFVIVAVMALAASALDADVADEGFGVVMSGGALLGLAALAPYVLLRLIPVFDAGMSSQLEGTFRRPTAAMGPPATGSRVTSLVRQRVGAGSSGAGGSPIAGTGGVGVTSAGASGTATSAGAAGVATAGVGLAAAGVVGGARGAVTAARRHSAGVGEVAASANGSSRPAATPPSTNGARPHSTQPAPPPTEDDQ
jgi:hypothetical protein